MVLTIFGTQKERSQLVRVEPTAAEGQKLQAP